MTGLPRLIADVKTYLGIPDYVESVIKKLKRRYERAKLQELKATVEANKQALFQQTMATMELTIRIITLEAMIADLELKEKRKPTPKDTDVTK